MMLAAVGASGLPEPARAEIVPLRASLHSDQRRIYDQRKRYNVLACGRRWGKSTLGGYLVTETTFNAGLDALWVFPSVPMAKSARAWDLLRRAAFELRQWTPGVEVRETDYTVRYPSGGLARLRSADDPDSLRGAGLGRVVIDEAALIQRRAWDEALRPALADRTGDAWFLTSPSGIDWIHELYLRGQNATDPDWKSWRRSTFDNPFFPTSERVQLEREYAEGKIPERVWRQEYLGEFVSHEGAVFRRLREAAVAWEQDPQPGAEYVIGVDLAKSVDFTVASVWHAADRRQVCIDRYNTVDYVVQEQRLAALAARYNNAVLIVETNNVGEAMCERLERRGLRLVRFTTTGFSKQEIVEAFAVALESGDAKILPDPTQLGELQSYGRRQNALGRSSYSAPDGQHDDTVMGACLAWSELGAGAAVGFLA